MTSMLTARAIEFPPILVASVLTLTFNNLFRISYHHRGSVVVWLRVFLVVRPAFAI